MKTLKTVGIILLVVIVLLLIISFFLPSEMKVERSMVIKSSPEVVFNQVNFLKNWEKWSPWHKIDKAMNIIYEGPESGQGACYKWESTNPKVGNGSLIITSVTPFDSISMDMVFMENDTAKSMFRFEKDSAGTKATWILTSHIGINPVSRYFGLIMKGMVENSFEKGLLTIDSVCQAMPPVPEVKIELLKVPKQNYIGIKSFCTMAEIGNVMKDSYGQIMTFMEKSGIPMTKPPISIYLAYTPERVDFISAIPVEKKVKTSGKIENGEIKEGNAAMALHLGPYENLEGTYQKIEEWIKTNNKKITGAPWEEYLTDPATEKDPAKWITKIFFPVE